MLHPGLYEQVINSALASELAEIPWSRKSDKNYSPTTMYHESLFHWQSQSTTAADSPTGQRYIHYRERGSRILLFVREFKTARITGDAAPYTYLGEASYVQHEGSPAHEHYLEAGSVHSGEVFEENQQIGGGMSDGTEDH